MTRLERKWRGLLRALYRGAGVAAAFLALSAFSWTGGKVIAMYGMPMPALENGSPGGDPAPREAAPPDCGGEEGEGDGE